MHFCFHHRPVSSTFAAMHPYNNKGKGGGAKNRGKTGGQNTRQNRCTLREVWASSGSTMDFADWVYSIQDQYDVLQDQQQNQAQNQQYYDATTGLTWVPTTMQPVYHAPATVATAPAGTTPTVYHPQPVLTTTAPPTAPTAPVVLQPQPLLTATPNTPAPPTPAPAPPTPNTPAPPPPNTPAPPPPNTPAPPPSQVVSSAPAAVKAKPPQAPDPTAAATTPSITSKFTNISKGTFTYTSTLCTRAGTMAQHWDSTDCSIEK